MEKSAIIDKDKDQVDSFYQLFDSVTSQMAIIDEHGNILEVNKAWQAFALENNAGNETTLDKGPTTFIA